MNRETVSGQRLICFVVGVNLKAYFYTVHTLGKDCYKHHTVSLSDYISQRFKTG